MSPPASPLVSICTPAYQAARWLPELAASVWTQDLDDFEWIVVDDGSSDGTWELLSAQGDPRLRAGSSCAQPGPAR
ncbi:MAG: glycosyltransferase [Chloroflexi bacterium]|jgi:glycosyltransferase involved in cell wall biosynthesis|nr:glycosyltransferase [Chloroflexota bacterium]